MDRAAWLQQAEEIYETSPGHWLVWLVLLRWSGLPAREYWTTLAEFLFWVNEDQDMWFNLILAEEIYKD